MHDIFIVGAGCRVAGAANLEEFKKLLAQGQCAVRAAPEGRWSVERFLHPDPAIAGFSYSFAGGYLDAPFDFDPAVFGISPREAVEMDPQQRLLLEVVFQAMEDAHLPPSRLSGKEVGVYVGASSLDHGSVLAADPGIIDRYFMTGNTLSVVANRLSHNFNLRGPSFTIDTACSSSMVALVQAVADLRAGRVDTAIVAGVNMLFNPISFIGFSRAMMLSPTGLCRPFSKAADGYVRAEGALAIILQRQDVAVPGAARAAIVAAETNNDGRTSGVALPSLEGQIELLRRIYGHSGILPDQLAFIEAHGTGTQVGDAVEGRAIGEVLGKVRNTPLPVGSVKSNIGHLEPASGMAGILKALCALETRRLAPTLHIDALNPNLDFKALGLRPARKAVKLPQDGVLHCGISSFGFGGSNAHVILRSIEQAIDPVPEKRDGGNDYIVVSAATAEAVADMAEHYRKLIVRGPVATRLSQAVREGREMMKFRAVLAAPALARLDNTRMLSVMGEAPSGSTKTCLFFSGNGSQWPGMGRTAYRTNAAFRARLDEIDQAFSLHDERSVSEDLMSMDQEAKFASASFIQPLLYAVQSATTAALLAEGITVDMVLGHSIGEIAAAEAAGMISTEEAVRIILARAACQEEIFGKGRMAVVSADLSAVEAELQAFGSPHIEIAADNGPASITITGASDDVVRFVQFCRKRRVATRLMDLEYPFHSRFLDPLEERLLVGIGHIAGKPASIPCFSTVTGERLSAEAMTARYWWHNFRQPVKFRQAIVAAGSDGANLFIEVGARQILQSAVQQTLRQAGHGAEVIASLTQGDDKTPQKDPIIRATARALAHGAILRGHKRLPDTPRLPIDRRLDLARYAWKRRSFHFQHTSERLDVFGSQPRHPLIGARFTEFSHEWRALLDTKLVPYLADHIVDGECVVPAAALAEMVLALGRELKPEGPLALQDLSIFKALTLLPNSMQEVCLRHSPETGMVTISSRKRFAADDWTLHAKARLVDTFTPPAALPFFGAVESEADSQTIYARAKMRGLDYGPAFRLMRHMRRSGDVLAVTLAKPAHGECAFRRNNVLAPQSFDAALHALFGVLSPNEDGLKTYLPTRIGGLRVFRDNADIVEARIGLLRETEQSLTVHISLLDGDGAVVGEADGVFLRSVFLRKKQKSAEIFVTSKKNIEGASVNRRALAALSVQPDDRSQDAASLLRAHMHAVTYAVFSALVDDKRFFDLAALEMQGRLASIAVPLAQRLADELVAFGLSEVSGSGYVLTQKQNLLDAPRILAAFAFDYPDAWSDLLVASLAANGLGSFLTEGKPVNHRPEVLRQFLVDGVVFEPCRALVLEALPLLSAREGRRPAVLLCGPNAESLLAPLQVKAEAGEIDLTIAATSGVELHRLQQALSPDSRIATRDLAALKGRRQFDLVLIHAVRRGDGTADYLEPARQLLRDGGIIACLQPPEDTLHDFYLATTAEGLSGGLCPMPFDALCGLLKFMNCLPLEGSRPTTHAAGVVVAAVPPAEKPGGAGPVLIRMGKGWSRPLAVKFKAQLLQSGRKVRVAYAHARETVLFVDGSGAGAARRLRHDMLVIARLMKEHAGPRKVWMVFRGATTAPADPDAEARWSFGRVLINEFPECDLRLVDIDPALANEEAARQLLALMERPCEVRELSLGPDGLSALKVERISARLERQQGALQLVTASQASTGRMDWLPATRRAPEAGEIEVRVTATGLNFRDLMLSMGLLDDDVLEGGAIGAVLGFECSGHVLRIGEGVSGIRPGDAVMGFAPKAFATHVTAPASGFRAVPKQIDAIAAAGLPVAFLTAWYALVEQARLREGETVLIHGAAGGVGLAALQIARAIGARIIATVSTPDKEALARLYGAEIVYNSRTLAFAEKIRAELGGVDVVLNSLNGDAMRASIRCLKPFGRFVELGKRDYMENTEISLRPFKRNLTYYGVDIDQLFAHAPETVERGLRHLVEGMNDGRYSALPCRSFAHGAVEDAFRLMQAAGHVGKIIVRAPPAGTTQEEEVPAAPPLAIGDGVELVVGGTSGFGLALAFWLAGQGAKRIVVASRSGKVSDETLSKIEELRATGIDFRIERVDVASAKSVERLIGGITSRMGPITGLYHTAAVLADQKVAGLQAKEIFHVLAPKVNGVLHLDAATRDQPIRHFVLFSSISALIGTIGQAAYAAANAFLNGVARRRREAGLPALSIGWGAIADTGMLTRDQTTAKILERMTGASALSAADALERLAVILYATVPVEPVVYITRRYARNAAANLSHLASPGFAALLDGAMKGEEQSASSLMERLESLATPERQKLVLGMIVEEVAQILRLHPSEVDARKGLDELGLDSLMALELRMNVESSLGVELPLVAITALKNLSELSLRIVEELGTTSAHAGSAEAEALYYIHGGS